MEPGNLIKTERLRRKLSQAGLAKKVGISQVAIKKIETGETRQSKHIPRIAQELEIPLAKLDSSLSQYGTATVNQPAAQPEPIRSQPLQLIPGEQLMGRVDLPVFSIVHGGRTGALVLSSEPFTSIARPQIVLGIKDAYGVLVKGNSMAREYNEGDIAYVDPHRHPKDGDPCIFQSHKDDGEVEAVIKYLARSPDASDMLWYVEQTNPPKKFTMKKADWQICHVVVGKQSGR